MYKSVQSTTSFKLYMVAAVLCGISAAAYGFGYSEGFQAQLMGLFAALFIIGGLFAKYGVGYAARTERHVGGGYYRSTVETADACICGLSTGLATIIMTLTGTSFLPGASVPAFLAGVVAIFAGLVAFRKSVSAGASAKPSVPSVPYDSISCSYCGKSGISPQASSCPNCGQPLK
ncbi:MAG: zinc ribbon domain-containing protein [Candidatus Thorarchaeota archaeon]